MIGSLVLAASLLPIGINLPLGAHATYPGAEASYGRPLQKNLAADVPKFSTTMAIRTAASVADRVPTKPRPDIRDGDDEKQIRARELYLLQQTVIANRNWVATFPDFEMRVYDRIKDIYRRAININRIATLGLILIVIVMLVSAWVASSRGRLPGRLMSEFEKARYRLFRLALKRRQRRVEKLLRALQKKADKIQDPDHAYVRLLDDIRNEILKLERELENMEPRRA